MALPTLQLRKLALTRVAQLTRGEIRGAALEPLATYPDLSDCRKLYFDEQQNEPGRRTGHRPQWRIVYRVLDALQGADSRMLLQVVAIGPRPHGEVYRLAGERLGRPEISRTPRAQKPAVPVQGSAGPTQGPQRQRSLTEAQQAAIARQRPYRGRVT